MKTESRSLVYSVANLTGMPRVPFALAVGFVLLVLLLGAACADGDLARGDVWHLWKMVVEPAVVVYILCASPWLQRHWSAAIDALRPLADRPDLVEQAHVVERRKEWAALASGAIFSFWASSSPTSDGRWLRLYDLASNALMFALLALVIYEGLVRSRRLTRIVHAGLHLDLFDKQLLTPLTRWGQTVSLAFVGGTCLSLLFQSSASLRTLQSLVIYSTLVVVSLTLFFTSIWSIHDALVAAQQRELAVVRHHWRLAREALKTRLAESGDVDVVGMYTPVVTMGAYEQQVLAASTWPFNPKTVKELVGSLVAPFLIYGLKVAIGLANS